MIRRKKVYRGFNKRRNNNGPKIVLVILCVSLIGGYTFVKVKEKISDSNLFSTGIFTKNVFKSDVFGNMIDKIAFWDNSEVETITNDDLSSELKKIQDEKADNKESLEQGIKENAKVAKIDGWKFYTVQVASVENENDVSNIENTLKENKIPFSTVEVDGVKKIQTYSYFDENTTRSYLEEVKSVFPDAFLSSIEVPMLSFKYSDKYSYANNISDGLNKLITNFEEESNFWGKNTETTNAEEYNKIMTKRKEILSEIKKQADKIDYKEMEDFKAKLDTYIQNTDENTDEASKATNEEQYDLSKSLFLSSMHGYFKFINSMREA